MCAPCAAHSAAMASAHRLELILQNVDPLEAAVVSVCEFHAGNARNVIPQTAELRGTVRTLTAAMRKLVEKRVHEVVAGVAQIISLSLTAGRSLPS